MTDSILFSFLVDNLPSVGGQMEILSTNHLHCQPEKEAQAEVQVARLYYDQPTWRMNAKLAVLSLWLHLGPIN